MKWRLSYLALLSLVDGHDTGPGAESLTCNNTVASRFQIMYLQDTTGSFYQIITNVKNQLPSFFEDIVAVNKQSVAGIAEFHDRTWEEGCYAFDIDLTTNMSAVHTYINAFETPGDNGADKPEDSWSGVYYTGQLASWQDPLPDVQDVKIIVVMTDEGPHYLNMPDYGGDPLNFTGNGTFDYDSVDCTTEYPDFNAVANWLIENDIYLVVLADHSYYKEELNSTQYWTDLIKEKSPELTRRSVVKSFQSSFYNAIVEAVTEVNCQLVPENQKNDDTIDSVTCGGNDTRFQLMYLQDGTGSMQIDYDHIKLEVPQFLRAVAETNNQSLVGFSQFWDRTADKCFHIDTQLTKDWLAVNDTIQAFELIGDEGTDKPEDVWSAVYYAAMNTAWEDPIPGLKDIKVIVIVTDEGPHYLNEPPYGPYKDTTNFTGNGPFHYDGVVDCTTEYPDFVTVANALIEKDVYLLVLAGWSYYQDKEGFDINRYWIDLIQTQSPELAKRTFNKGIPAYGKNIYANFVEGLTNISCVLYPADDVTPPKTCTWHNH